MLSNIEKNIITYALRLRAAAGEDPKEILKTYTKLTDEEKYEILTAVKGE